MHSGWDRLVGHEAAIHRFRQAIAHEKLASTYLMVGPSGIGKRTFARLLAQALLCEQFQESDLDSCDECPACQQVQAATHPDLMLLGKPADKAFIPVELLIGRREKRMREGLCYDISRKPFRGGRKIAIIDDADFLNQESANALLKTLEEPPPRSLLILLGTSEHRQLPTIRSRSQVVRFRSLRADEVQTVLASQALKGFRDELELDEQSAVLGELAKLSNGSVASAMAFADPEMREFHLRLREQIRSLDPGRDDFAKAMESFVEAAGKDAALRRARMRTVCDMAIGCYREMLVEDANDSGVDPTRLANCIERCMDAQNHSRANMSSSNLIESWLSDLGRLARGEHVLPIAVW